VREQYGFEIEKHVQADKFLPYSTCFPGSFVIVSENVGVV